MSPFQIMKEEFIKLTKDLTNREFRLLCLFIVNATKTDIFENKLSTESTIHDDVYELYKKTNIGKIIEMMNESVFDDDNYYSLLGECFERENTNAEGRVADYGI